MAFVALTVIVMFWLAAALLTATICRMAARADAELAVHAPPATSGEEETYAVARRLTPRPTPPGRG